MPVWALILAVAALLLGVFAWSWISPLSLSFDANKRPDRHYLGFGYSKLRPPASSYIQDVRGALLLDIPGGGAYVIAWAW